LHAYGDEAASLGFSAGLMHDIGEMALAACRPGLWRDAPADEGLDQQRARFGADHARAGAYLLGLWGLPAQVVDAVARHHESPDPACALQAALALAESVASMRQARVAA
jgi:HD-like signal output (HDOD) protein